MFWTRGPRFLCRPQQRTADRTVRQSRFPSPWMEPHGRASHGRELRKVHSDVDRARWSGTQHARENMPRRRPALQPKSQPCREPGPTTRLHRWASRHRAHHGVPVRLTTGPNSRRSPDTRGRLSTRLPVKTVFGATAVPGAGSRTSPPGAAGCGGGGAHRHRPRLHPAPVFRDGGEPYGNNTRFCAAVTEPDGLGSDNCSCTAPMVHRALPDRGAHRLRLRQRAGPG